MGSGNKIYLGDFPLTPYSMKTGSPAFSAVLIMAGGKGTRIGNPFKFLLPIGETTILGRLIAYAGKISPEVWICSAGSSIPILLGTYGVDYSRIIEGSGEGYSQDLSYALGQIGKTPVLVLPADAVFIDYSVVDELFRLAGRSQSGIISIKQDGRFTGVSVVLSLPEGSEPLAYEDFEAAGACLVNVNTEDDYQEARKLIEQ